ncbi:hypothetical protein AYI68_g4127 [Smittium mucronatum]|uniref:Uncharacterized protein n=1 Tax=Smittium mucronatum TaxID=133383 RepID=A0A1R0GY49_9FUNG|nr:hypothetical protein AYI68_g4127 [Smittium mucronatum]
MDSNSFLKIKIPTTTQEIWAPKASNRFRFNPKILRTAILISLIASSILNIYFILKPKPLPLSNFLDSEFSQDADGEKTKNLEPPKKINYKEITDLILVPGHAVYSGEGSALNENNWLLESFQTGGVDIFVKHIKKGIEVLQQSESSLLIFSG